MTSLARALTCAFGALVSVIAAWPVNAEALVIPRRLQVVIIVDDSVAGTKNEALHLEAALKSWNESQQEHDGPYHIHYLPLKRITFAAGMLLNEAGNGIGELTETTLLEEIARLQISPNTALLCFFMGHGVGHEGKRTLLLDNIRGRGDARFRVESDALLKALTQEEADGDTVRPHFTLLLTDCCARFELLIESAPTHIEGEWDGGVFGELIASDVGGSMHITSATFNPHDSLRSQSAWAPKDGTMFGEAFRDLVRLTRAEATSRQSMSRLQLKALAVSRWISRLRGMTRSSCCDTAQMRTSRDTASCYVIIRRAASRCLLKTRRYCNTKPNRRPRF